MSQTAVQNGLATLLQAITREPKGSGRASMPTAWASAKGLVRPENQDRLIVARSSDLVFAVLADGMGGMRDGAPPVLFSTSRSPIESIGSKALEAYRKHQRQKENVRLAPGVAFPLLRRLLRLNDGVEESKAPTEVVLLSKNDPDTGLRVLNSIEKHSLGISRAVFVNGGNPFRYMNALNASLFLSANVSDVRKAVEGGLPAGRVFPTSFSDSEDDLELRIAFDFDGVIADDASETVYKRKGLKAFQVAEIRKALRPLKEGPLARFFKEISRLQQFERDRRSKDSRYAPRLRTAIITARNAPAHKRVVATLRSWGIAARASSGSVSLRFPFSDVRFPLRRHGPPAATRPPLAGCRGRNEEYVCVN